MPAKVGPVFTFSLPGGKSRPLPPVSYATTNRLGTNWLWLRSADLQRSWPAHVV